MPTRYPPVRTVSRKPVRMLSKAAFTADAPAPAAPPPGQKERAPADDVTTKPATSKPVAGAHGSAATRHTQPPDGSKGATGSQGPAPMLANPSNLYKGS